MKICKLRVGDEEDKRDLNECFAMFKVLHHVIDSADILRRITFQSLVDFVYADGACYVELRTTPRAIISPSGESITKREYLEAVCDTIDAFKSAVHAQSHPSEAKVSSATSTNQTSLTVPGPALHFVDAGLLVSIDRSTSLSEAQDTLDLVVKMREEGRCIVGLDFRLVLPSCVHEFDYSQTPLQSSVPSNFISSPLPPLFFFFPPSPFLPHIQWQSLFSPVHSLFHCLSSSKRQRHPDQYSLR